MKDVAICLFLYLNETSRFHMKEINNLLKTLYKYSFTEDNRPQIVLLTNVDGIKSQDDSLVIPIDKSAYKNSHLELMKCKLDIFKLNQFKRVVYIDTDILFCKDVSDLWDLNKFNEADIYGRVESTEYSDYATQEESLVNCGLLILNERVLTGEVFNGLVDLINKDPFDFSKMSTDQKIISIYLSQHPEIKVGFLPLAYNTYVWNIDTIIPASEVKGVHFVGTIKPWQITEMDLTARHIYNNILQRVA